MGPEGRGRGPEGWRTGPEETEDGPYRGQPEDRYYGPETTRCLESRGTSGHLSGPTPTGSRGPEDLLPKEEWGPVSNCFPKLGVLDGRTLGVWDVSDTYRHPPTPTPPTDRNPTRAPTFRGTPPGRPPTWTAPRERRSPPGARDTRVGGSWAGGRATRGTVLHESWV